MLAAIILLGLGFVACSVVWVGLEGVAEFAGRAWRKTSRQEKARRRRAQEYLRSHPEAIRAPWRDWNND